MKKINKKTTIPLFVIALLVSYVLLTLSPTVYGGDASASDHSVTITGHRGAAGLAPENTLAAISVALDYGVERIEIDVQQTKDSVVIVLHDRSLDRTTDGVGEVRDLNYNEILKYSAGSKFDEKFASEKVPTLEQVLQLIDGKAVLVIEIKDGNKYYPGIEQRSIDLVHKYDAKDWSIVHSFYDEVLYKINEMDPSIELHKLLVGDLPFIPVFYDGSFQFANIEKYDFVDEISLMAAFVTPRFIDKVHAMGKKVNVWTVRDSLDARKFINLGVDGIITDYPNYLINK